VKALNECNEPDMNNNLYTYKETITKKVFKNRKCSIAENIGEGIRLLFCTGQHIHCIHCIMYRAHCQILLCLRYLIIQPYRKNTQINCTPCFKWMRLLWRKFVMLMHISNSASSCHRVKTDLLKPECIKQ